MKSEIEQLAADLAAARKASGAKVRYPEELKRRAAILYRRQGAGSTSSFAEALGVSATAVTAWAKLGDAPSVAALMPVHVAKSNSISQKSPTSDGIIALCYLGVEIKLPASTPAAQIAQLAAALVEARRC